VKMQTEPVGGEDGGEAKVDVGGIHTDPLALTVPV